MCAWETTLMSLIFRSSFSQQLMQPGLSAGAISHDDSLVGLHPSTHLVVSVHRLLRRMHLGISLHCLCKEMFSQVGNTGSLFLGHFNRQDCWTDPNYCPYIRMWYRQFVWGPWVADDLGDPTPSPFNQTLSGESHLGMGFFMGGRSVDFISLVNHVIEDGFFMGSMTILQALVDQHTVWGMAEGIMSTPLTVGYVVVYNPVLPEIFSHSMEVTYGEHLPGQPSHAGYIILEHNHFRWVSSFPTDNICERHTSVSFDPEHLQIGSRWTEMPDGSRLVKWEEHEVNGVNVGFTSSPTTEDVIAVASHSVPPVCAVSRIPLTEHDEVEDLLGEDPSKQDTAISAPHPRLAESCGVASVHVDLLSADGQGDVSSKTGLCGPITVLIMLSRWEKLWWVPAGGMPLTRYSTLSIVATMVGILQDKAVLDDIVGNAVIVEEVLATLISSLRSRVAAQLSFGHSSGDFHHDFIRQFQAAEMVNPNASPRQALISLLEHHACWMTPLLLVPTIWAITDTRQLHEPRACSSVSLANQAWYWIVVHCRRRGRRHWQVPFVLRAHCTRGEDVPGANWDRRMCIGICVCRNHHWDLITAPTFDELLQFMASRLVVGEGDIEATLMRNTVDWSLLAGGSAAQIMPSWHKDCKWSVHSHTAHLRRMAIATPGGIHSSGNRYSEGKSGWLVVCEMHKVYWQFQRRVSGWMAMSSLSFLAIRTELTLLLQGQVHFLRDSYDGRSGMVSLLSQCREHNDSGVIMHCTWTQIESVLSGRAGVTLPIGFKDAAQRARSRCPQFCLGNASWILKDLLDLDMGWLSPFVLVPLFRVLCDKMYTMKDVDINSVRRPKECMLWYYLVVVPIGGGDPHVFRVLCEAVVDPSECVWCTNMVVGVSWCLHGAWSFSEDVQPVVDMVARHRLSTHDWGGVIPYAYDMSVFVTAQTLGVYGLGDPVTNGSCMEATSSHPAPPLHCPDHLHSTDDMLFDDGALEDRYASPGCDHGTEEEAMPPIVIEHSDLLLCGCSSVHGQGVAECEDVILECAEEGNEMPIVWGGHNFNPVNITHPPLIEEEVGQGMCMVYSMVDMFAHLNWRASEVSRFLQLTSFLLGHGGKQLARYLHGVTPNEYLERLWHSAEAATLSCRWKAARHLDFRSPVCPSAFELAMDRAWKDTVSCPVVCGVDDQAPTIGGTSPLRQNGESLLS
jgi:hypothetical protein